METTYKRKPSLKPNGSGDCYPNKASDKQLALLEEQIDALQKDLTVLTNQVNDFGTSFSTASASITKLTSDVFTSNKGNIKYLETEKLNNKQYIKGYLTKESESASIPLGTFTGSADIDLTVRKDDIQQFIKIRVLKNNIIIKSNNNLFVDNIGLTNVDDKTFITLKNTTGGLVKVLYHLRADDFNADETLNGTEALLSVGDKITISGILDVNTDNDIHFTNATIDNLTTNSINVLDILNAVNISATDITSDNANLLTATIDNLNVTEGTITTLHSDDIISTNANIKEFASDNIDNTGDISTKTLSAIDADIVNNLYTPNVKLDKEYQLPVIGNTDTQDILFSFKAGIASFFIDGALSVTVIKNTVDTSNVLVSYSQKSVGNIISIKEFDNGDIAFTTGLSGLTVRYGIASPDVEEDRFSIYTVLNNTATPRLNHSVTKMNHTVILGDNTSDYGISVDGEVKATIIPLPGKTSFENLDISNELIVGGDTKLKDLYVDGNIIQRGESYETHAEQLYTTKDMIITRDKVKPEDPDTPLAEGALTGIKALHYDAEGNNGVLAFDNTGTARVGDEGFEQPIATRDEEDAMVNGNIVAWNGTDRKLTTPKVAIVDGHTLAKTDDAFMLYGAQGMNNIPSPSSLDDLVKCGQYSADEDIGNTITEKPANETGAFDLTVGYFNADKSLPYQVYTGKTSKKVYYRFTTDGMYDESWKEVANIAEVENLIKTGTAQTAITHQAINIKDLNLDINSLNNDANVYGNIYTGLGSYWSVQENLPEQARGTQGFSLEVLPNSHNTIHIYRINKPEGVITWLRSFDNGKWSEWQQLATIDGTIANTTKFDGKTYTEAKDDILTGKAAEATQADKAKLLTDDTGTSWGINYSHPEAGEVSKWCAFDNTNHTLISVSAPASSKEYGYLTDARKHEIWMSLDQYSSWIDTPLAKFRAKRWYNSGRYGVEIQILPKYNLYFMPDKTKMIVTEYNDKILYDITNTITFKECKKNVTSVIYSEVRDNYNNASKFIISTMLVFLEK